MQTTNTLRDEATELINKNAKLQSEDKHEK